jgi:16S rRNA (guanine966-N2)-methyltransferase
VWGAPALFKALVYHSPPHDPPAADLADLSSPALATARVAPMSARGHGEGQVRIIGGRWRNTRLAVPDLEGLRPTSDRVRETLFNWLMPRLPGARVLDLFAGSGALGLEAVSRGAASACLVERDPGLAARLRAQVAKLGAEGQVQVQQEDVLRWLASAPAPRFDIAFVDPPFAAGLWNQVLAALPAHLAADAWLYVEAPHPATPARPADWLLHREGATREVRYALYRRAAATLTSPSRGNPA